MYCNIPSLDFYRQLIEEGWTPVWTGRTVDKHPSKVLVKLGRKEERLWVVADVPEVDSSMFSHAIKGTANSPGSDVCVFPASGGQSLIRKACVLGIGPYMRLSAGIGSGLPEPSVRRIVGLDIEQSTAYRDGGFPLPHDPITSIAISTWDNRYYCRYSVGYHDTRRLPPERGYDVRRVANSHDLAMWALDWLIENHPDFVVVHNGYSYDVRVLAANCNSSYNRYFKVVNLGKADKGYDFDIDGVTMVDTLRYLDKIHRGDYESMSLDSLSLATCGVGKSEQPRLDVRVHDIVDMTDTIYYNIHDATLHIMVAEATGCITEIVSMCSVYKSYLSDVVRFNSGTMVMQMLASHALGEGILIDWSDELWPDRGYTGALVLSPKPGFYRNVFVLDVGSMYPSIMVDANISMETPTSLDYDELSEASPPVLDCLVDWDIRGVTVHAEGLRTRFSNTRQGVTAMALRYLIEERKRIGKSTPTGWAMKMGTNSMYGALGARTSKLQSYRGASSITAIGRLITVLASCVASLMGFKVIYGDTDSVFVSKTSEMHISVSHYLDTIHNILRHTPFESVHLEFEKTYSKFIIVKPKMYYGIRLLDEGKEKVEIKGLAAVRKDRPSIVKSLVLSVCSYICEVGLEKCRLGVRMLILEDIAKIELGLASVEECSIERRRGGMPFLVHKNSEGVIVWLRTDMMETYEGTVLKEWVVSSITSSLDPILLVCGLPSVSIIRSQAHRIEYE